MADSGKKPRKALLIGLDHSVEVELAAALKASGLAVVTPSSARVDVVFCSHDKAVYSRLVRQYAPVPVIIATRLPEMADWLDALETGAADYCAAPFEPTQLRWLMDTHAPLVRHAAA